MAAPLVGLVAALTVAACGVPPSGVIQAGAPASGLYSPTSRPPVSSEITLYFLHNGELEPYARKTGDPGDLGAAVRLLFMGPTAGETARVTTELPRLTATPKVGGGGGNTVIIQLPPGVAAFSGLAMQQLECTVANATPTTVPLPGGANRAGTTGAPSVAGQGSLGRTSVQVLGDGWTMTQSGDTSCPDPLQP